MEKRKIIIDCDPGIDDACAILLATRRPELDLLGLTTVCGNVNLEFTTRNALRVLKAIGREDIKVYKGMALPLVKPYQDASDTHGNDGLGGAADLEEPTKTIEEEHAVDYLVRMAREHKGEITLLPIGPLTNIAKAIEKDPEFVKNIKEVVLMGGGLGDGNCSPVAEFNFWVDPHAARDVLAAGFEKLTIVGLNATRKIVMTPNIREIIRQLRAPLTKFIYDITEQYIEFHWVKERTIGCVVNDPLVVAYLIDPTVIDVYPCFADVSVDGITNGESVIDINGVYQGGRCNSYIAMNADAKKFFEMFFESVFPDYVSERELMLETQFD